MRIQFQISKRCTESSFFSRQQKLRKSSIFAVGDRSSRCNATQRDATSYFISSALLLLLFYLVVSLVCSTSLTISVNRPGWQSSSPWIPPDWERSYLPHVRVRRAIMLRSKNCSRAWLRIREMRSWDTKARWANLEIQISMLCMMGYYVRLLLQWSAFEMRADDETFILEWLSHLWLIAWIHTIALGCSIWCRWAVDKIRSWCQYQRQGKHYRRYIIIQHGHSLHHNDDDS